MGYILCWGWEYNDEKNLSLPWTEKDLMMKMFSSDVIFPIIGSTIASM